MPLKITRSFFKKHFFSRYLYKNFCLVNYFCSTQHPCPSVKYTMKLEPSVDKALDSKEMKHRKHPGIRKEPTYSLPPKLLQALNEMNNLSRNSILKEVETFSNQLAARRLPIEKEEVEYKMQTIFPNIGELGDLSDEEKQFYMNLAKKKLQCELKRWKPIDYTDEQQCILYLLSRLAPNYAAVMKVFSEIKLFLPEFKPKLFFDFGSGVGSATWAAYNTWEKSIKEYFCVDTSAKMNELCEALLKGGKSEESEDTIKNLFFRQFLPASNKIQYDLVVSAYSLTDLPSAVDRLRTIDTLWRKTTDLLVLVEAGSKAGFSTILDARDFILKMEASQVESGVSSGAYVVCPCPHEFTCPRFEELNFLPCTNAVSYQPLVPKRTSSKRLLFSYVVLRKGPKPDDHITWPRIVKPIIKSSRHVHCHLCSKDGKLNAVIVTRARHGNNAYRCAKSSSLGDLLPITELKKTEEPEQILNDEVDDSDDECNREER